MPRTPLLLLLCALSTFSCTNNTTPLLYLQPSTVLTFCKNQIVSGSISFSRLRAIFPSITILRYSWEPEYPFVRILLEIIFLGNFRTGGNFTAYFPSTLQGRGPLDSIDFDAGSLLLWDKYPSDNATVAHLLLTPTTNGVRASVIFDIL
jgi:hypothetical protein